MQLNLGKANLTKITKLSFFTQNKNKNKNKRSNDVKTERRLLKESWPCKQNGFDQNVNFFTKRQNFSFRINRNVD